MAAPIVNQTFVSKATIISASWLNGVNDVVNNSTQDITGATARTVPAKLADIVSVKDFGAVGDWNDNLQIGTNDTAAIQAAVNYACANSVTLFVPPGNYCITQPIVFPNTSFYIEGAGPTSVAFQTSVASGITELFDLTACNGPAKIIRNISFKGPQTGDVGNAAAIYGIGNGLTLENVWFRGVKYGLNCGGSSFVNTINCVAEYCSYGVRGVGGVIESVWLGWTFYKNGYDIYLDSSCQSLVIGAYTTIGCQYNSLLLAGASHVNVLGVSAQDTSPASGYTPILIEVTGAGKYNTFSNISATNFGLVGIRFTGANANNNNFSNVDFYGVATGVYFSEAKYNQGVNVRITAATSYGAVFDTGATNYINGFVFDTCAYGAWIAASNSLSLTNGTIKNSSTADFYYPTDNTAIVYIDNVAADFTAINGIQYIGRHQGMGNKMVSVVSVPSGTDVTFAVGDSAYPRSPSVGNPKGWLCTVAGAPGTWVSTGNL